MALTGAERQKEYRERLKQEKPEEYDTMMQYSRSKAADWRRKNPDKVAGYNNNHRYYKYGLTDVAIANLFASQAGKCAICQKELELNASRKWVVDHNHTTGKVRGILCYPCNVSLGQFQDSPEMLTRAINYLKEKEK